MTTQPYYHDKSVTLYHGDCIEILAAMPDNSVDAIVTDPPYGLGFMGKAWDDLPPGLPWAQQCLRVLKPGGYLLAFGGTRTWHRLTCAVEDAGFEVRDSIAWLYGSGFPKSLDVSKAIGKAAGAQGGYGGPKSAAHAGWVERGGKMRGTEGHEGFQRPWMDDPEAVNKAASTYLPATDEAQQWQGWGTALKPAFEPIVVARKPLAGTVAVNVQQWGTGAINVDGCRVNPGTPVGGGGNGAANVGGIMGPKIGARPRVEPHTAGRWPTNVVLDGAAADGLDQQSGTLKSGKLETHHVRNPKDAGILGAFGSAEGERGYGDSGGASRFFPVFRYQAKAPTRERPSYHRPSCDCETVKPCEGQSPSRDTAVCESAADRSWNTSTSGSSTTGDPSHPDTTFTTSTATSSTTTSAISGASPSSNTSASTPGVNSATASGGSLAASALNSSPSTQTTGTSAPKAGPSTGVAAPVTSVSSLSAVPNCGVCGAPQKKEAHSTVKPLELLRWLVRLVTPPGGVVLDCFAGSGTTVEAAILEGFRCVAVEREADYLPLILARIERQPATQPPATPTAAEDLSLFDFEEPA